MKKHLLLLVSISAFLIQACGQQFKAELDTFMSTSAQQKKFNGSVLVVRGGQVLMEKGYGYRDAASGKMNDAQTVYQIGSVTKQFTAAVIMALQERKLKVFHLYEIHTNTDQE